MSAQQTLPGTDRVIGTYSCGHDRTHQLPSDSVALLKSGGAGFIGYCTCGGHDLETAGEKPHILGPHATLLGGTNLDPHLWLALEAIAEWGWCDPDAGAEHGNEPYEVRRKNRREEYEAKVSNGGDQA